MPKTNKERLQDNNTALLRIKGKAENLPPAGGGSEPNIFVQLEEPEVKKGIWLKKDTEYEHYTCDDEVFIGGTWEPDGKYRNMPNILVRGSAISIGTNIYTFYSTSAYKYDILTNTYTQLTDIPYSYSGASPSAVVIGTNIYLFGGGSATTTAYKYDTSADTYTKLTNIPYDFYSGVSVAIGTDVYLLGGGNSYPYRFNYKYNTLTDTYTQLTDIPYDFKFGSACAIGTNIYLFGSSYSSTERNKAYKYDTLTDTYTQLTNIPYNFANGAIAVVSTDIYILGGAYDNKKFYKYNTLTDTYTQLTDIPYNFYDGAVTMLNNKIYLFGGEFNATKVQCYAVESKTYQQDNLVVINQGKYANVGYEIELFSNNKAVEPAKYAFVDAWFYTLQNGLDGTMPVYYGNGTQWINIKNPPTTD